MSEKGCDIGMIGLGVMGRNLLLNMANHGFSVVGYDLDKEKIASLRTEGKNLKVTAAGSIESFIQSLRKPRAIMMLVPAGKAVDTVIDNLIPYLDKGDLIIDGGNSHFTDTNERIHRLQKLDLDFLGVGISGGEEGARLGPSIMPGGNQSAYERIRPIFEAVAAKVANEPCVTYIGTGSSGHYVKMVHNGIEYALMQLLAETYDLMKRGLSLTNQQLHEIYSQWNEGELNSYLIEITANIFAKMDVETHHALIDEIRGVAKQTGTGMWTSESGMELQLPIPTIDIAVSMRDLSVLTQQRIEANKFYNRPIKKIKIELSALHSALEVAMIIAYAQGFALLNAASEKYQYGLNLQAIAKIWRGGCIIRSKLLTPISNAFARNDHLKNLLLDADLATKVNRDESQLRKVVHAAIDSGIAMPAFMSALSYLDAYRSVWMPANLIQAQRDYFGSHQYERIDREGSFHTLWEKD